MRETLSPWRDNPREGLKGLPAVVESFDEFGAFLTTKHSSCQVRQLYTGRDGRRVVANFPGEQNTFVYDTTVYDTTDFDFDLDGTSALEARTVIQRASLGTAHLRSSTIPRQLRQRHRFRPRRTAPAAASRRVRSCPAPSPYFALTLAPAP